MKLIYIYGSPASGKLTIAKELAKRTKFRLFHNHLILDMLTQILNFKHKSFWNTFNNIFTEIIKGAKEQNANLIITRAYSGKEDFKEHLNIADKTFLIRLKCSDEEILKRITNEDRKKYGKINDKKNYLNWKSKILKESFSDDEIVVDTGKLSVDESVEKIILKLKD